ncbi:MAG TPA: copper transporter [Propionibacteriaceae bacterium]|nr:copper transporter [Propionibacteriaceae bacterium]
MINFKYHIVSLVAVFIALSVGIAVGVALSPAVDTGLLRQAEQDRKQVTELRAEINRRNALDAYRQAYDEQAGAPLIEGALRDVRVAVVAMPDAPGRVVTDLTAAVATAGGTVVREVEVRPDAFDPARAETVTETLAGLADQVPLGENMTQAEKVGAALARSIASPQAEARDQLAVDLATALTGGGFATISRGTDAQAQLVVVVGAQATDPPVEAELLTAHVQLNLALRDRAAVVVAGPNSAGIEGTDVLAVRTDPEGSRRLSTVDVADLSSGVVTTVLAGKEQLLGREGRHYGALARAEAPLPTLPVR